mmetsp:Transcript_69909/g.138525  ORF Transcript_69909/g.138525 Transcript_69909/m.138525 type:complete len:314 (-) Transcript_69909:359-1300(-)
MAPLSVYPSPPPSPPSFPMERECDASESEATVELEPPQLCEPVPLRAFQPCYASFTTTASSELSSASSVAENDATKKQHGEQPKRRLAIQAPTTSVKLLGLLHRMVGHANCDPCKMMSPEAGSVVKVIGWREVPSQSVRNRSHLVYTILAAAPSGTQDTSEARLVQRRYSDFVKLHAALVPHARQAGLTLPALPSKLSSLGRRLSPAVGTQRQKMLHAWLCWVVSHSQLLCDALRLFLGLSPRGPGEAEEPLPGPDVAMEVDMNANMDAAMETSVEDQPQSSKIAVDLAHLEHVAVAAMLDDDLWGRPRAPCG